MSLRFASKCLMVVLVASGLLQADPISTIQTSRRPLKTVQPAYPELARRIRLEGFVRVEITIMANGNVRSARLLGGSSILADSALNAVMMWRYEPASEETKTVVTFNFGQ